MSQNTEKIKEAWSNFLASVYGTMFITGFLMVFSGVVILFSGGFYLIALVGVVILIVTIIAGTLLLMSFEEDTEND